MAYNKRNLLLKIIEIQEIVLREQKRGVSQIWVYRNLIAPVYFISFRTYNAYLATNAKKELEDLDKLEAENRRQLLLIFEE